MNDKRKKRVRYKLRKITSRKRLTVFRSNLHIYAQVIDDSQGVTIASASTIEKNIVKSEIGRKELAEIVGNKIAERCIAKGVKLTDQRRIIAKVMSNSQDHPDVNELYLRVSKLDSRISIATVYRTVKLFEEAGIITKHDFKGGKARYEEVSEGHHDHLIDVNTGEIIEFVDDEIELLQKKVAEKYGYNLVDHKLELYGIKKKS